MARSQHFSDSEYHNLWGSLQAGENHCEFKQVLGNLWYCCSSGQAHVCDQNCSQRIFYDNHHDICRLSKRIFPREEAPMGDLARKRSGEEGGLEQSAKRPQSGDWHAAMQAQALQQQAQQAQWQQQAQQAAMQQAPAPHGFAC
ncbi:hypothetical protein COHA_004618 [Chlorella ohadii]|uniref:Uncharacterized protein n=1 Tax=Chlorella ohadii TaxID=2649997 RepID=A0AAD5DQ99_9CHLO|nr:hypothetical protein COHA_004618 [Chlorella ohadii]